MSRGKLSFQGKREICLTFLLSRSRVLYKAVEWTASLTMRLPYTVRPPVPVDVGASRPSVPFERAPRAGLST